MNVYYADEFSFIYSQSVYPEVRSILNTLRPEFRIGIYSEGAAKFQNNKFRSLGLDEYFDDKLIFIRDAKDVEPVAKEIPKGAIIIDDKEHICEFLFKNGIKAIWLNKKDNSVSQDFTTIHNLLELPEILL